MSHVLLVTAVRPETHAVVAGLQRPVRRPAMPARTFDGHVGSHLVTVVQGGIGPSAAGRAVASVAGSWDALVSIGFAGGLIAGLAPGTLLLPDTVVWERSGALTRFTVAPGMLDALESGLPPAVRAASVRGTLLSSPVVLATTAAKTAAAEQYAAVGVEMECAALVECARDLGIPFVAARAVLDPFDLSLAALAPWIAGGWTARARTLATPAVWPLLATLRQHAALAGATITTVVATGLATLCADVRRRGKSSDGEP
jgi:nucleoside phosphorylase